ncbi:hypothetical protein U1Q18_038022 [Sarracenia purpurea var. burkii]
MQILGYGWAGMLRRYLVDPVTWLILLKCGGLQILLSVLLWFCWLLIALLVCLLLVLSWFALRCCIGFCVAGMLAADSMISGMLKPALLVLLPTGCVMFRTVLL